MFQIFLGHSFFLFTQTTLNPSKINRKPHIKFVPAIFLDSFICRIYKNNLESFKNQQGTKYQSLSAFFLAHSFFLFTQTTLNPSKINRKPQIKVFLLFFAHSFFLFTQTTLNPSKINRKPHIKVPAIFSAHSFFVFTQTTLNPPFFVGFEF